MEEKKLPTQALGIAMLMMLCLMISAAQGCPGDGSGCKDCIVNQMKYNCPSCISPIRCMARCLWGGSLRSKCLRRCNCGGGSPKLSECKRCVARCKCSCVA